MDDFNDNEIGKLLRLKRYEQPPPEYFENFLHEFHRRQRDQLLREPLWRLCLQRAHDFMFRLNVPSLASYPVAAAAILICAAVISLKVYQTAQPVQFAQQTSAIVNQSSANLESDWSLAKPVSTRDFSSPLFRTVKARAHTHRAAAPPRYVLDSVPVSYEPAFTF
jgi:hypothetical protein